MKLFDGVAGLVNGHMFSGLWADTVVVRLADADHRAVLAMPSGGAFDPTGRGRVMKDMALLPNDLLQDPLALRRWLAKALVYTATLPPKVRTAAAPKKTAALKKKTAGKKTAAKKTAAKKTAAGKKTAGKKKKKKKTAAGPKKTAGPNKTAPRR